MQLTPGQAHYVITRLLNERRLTATGIARYLNDLQHEITTIEERLALLRAAAPTSTPSNTPPRRRGRPSRTPSNTARIPSNTTPLNARATRTTRGSQHISPATRALRKLQGQYVGYMRRLTEREKQHFHAIKERKGFPAAIAALREHLGK